MQVKDLENFPQKCRCRTCKICKLHNINNFAFGRIGYYFCVDQMQLIQKDEHIFENFQVFNLLGELPWEMRNALQRAFNSHDDFFKAIRSKNVYETENRNFFSFMHGAVSDNVKTITLENRLNEDIHYIQITKYYNFSLKSIFRFKVLNLCQHKETLQWFIKNSHLPFDIYDFLLSLQ